MSRKALILFVLLLPMITSTMSFQGARYETHGYTFPTLRFFPKMPVSKSDVTNEGVLLGRYLFYDSILSKTRNMSCASCHKQQFAFSDGGTAFSKGSDGRLLLRNTPPLFDLAWYSSFFWDGRAGEIEQQVFEPVRAHNEMALSWPDAEQRITRSELYRKLFFNAYGRRKIDSVLIADAIGQFERTLISYRSKYDKVLAGDAVFDLDEAEGFVLVNDMTKGDCLHCHTTDADALGTTGSFSNNGLDSIQVMSNYKDKGRGAITGRPSDQGLFKIPSLRNVALTAPYMHDGRFNTLKEVMAFYATGVNNCVNIDPKMEFAKRHGNHLTVEEQRKVICFLHTLTDSVLIVDQAFSDPFLQHKKRHK